MVRHPATKLKAFGDTPAVLPHWVFYILGGYLAGSIPFGRIIGKAVSQIDVTRHGSGNVGATNVAREVGLGWGLLTLFLDGLKGFLPVFLYAHQNPGHEIGASLVGLSTLVGHQFSLFQGFRGGKGVSTALGFFAAISPLSCLIAVPLFMISVYWWGFVSLGSIISTCAMPIILGLLHEGVIYVLSSVAVAGLICLRHKDNFQRLAKGKEPKWGRFRS